MGMVGDWNSQFKGWETEPLSIALSERPLKLTAEQQARISQEEREAFARADAHYRQEYTRLVREEPVRAAAQDAWMKRIYTH